MSIDGQQRGQRGPDRASLAIAVGLLATAALVAWDAAHISGNAAIYSGVGPEVFPYIIAGALTLLALATAFQSFRHGAQTREPIDWAAVSWILGGLVGQIVLLGYAGFSVATGFLFGMAARGIGRRGRLWVTIPVGIVLSLVVYLIFTKGLQLSLPAGPLERMF